MKAVKKKLWTGWIRIQKILTEKDGISTVELILVLVGILTTYYDMIPSSRTQKYKNLLGGILCPEKVKLMQ